MKLIKLSRSDLQGVSYDISSIPHHVNLVHTLYVQ